MNPHVIIIGAGSAGCALAGRLSEDPALEILLLEAGTPDKRQEIRIPAAFSKLFNTEQDWAYATEPQAHVDNRRLYWPRGKMLGGSSSMNAMIYQRGHPRDYDRWAEQGNETWAYSDVLPYFMRAEDSIHSNSPYHGTGGPLTVRRLRDPNSMSNAFVEAAAQIGFPHNHDFNGAVQEGFGLYEVTQARGRRMSAAAAYLKPALNRPNLHVETGAHATRLQFEGRRCVGVQYVQNGQTRNVRAAREVILCGGAINSPQLLMLSGIGDGAALQALGIPVVHDLPGVGRNLQDHLAYPVSYAATQPVSLIKAESIGNLLNFLLRGRGMLTSNVGEAGGFVKILPESPVPDLQFHFAPAYFIDHGFQVPDGHGFTIAPTLVHVKSRGTIALASADPMTPPRIDPNYLDHPDDMKILVEGVKLARRLAHAPAFDPYRGPEHTPGSDAEDDAALAGAIRALVQSLYHPVGTCKMGVDPMAVVSPSLQVHGIDGLRVADASIMPSLINANTNAPSIMIGERAADFIRSDAA